MTEQPITILLCDMCGKPVKEHHKDDIGTQFYICEAEHQTANPIKKNYAPMMYEHFSTFCDNEGIFNPARFAKDLVDNYFFKTDKRSGTVYIFNAQTGTWDSLGEVFIQQAMLEKLQVELRSHYYNDILFYVKAATYTDITETTNKLAVNNGILNLNTLEIEQPNPGEFILTKLPVTYDKIAQCQTILKFLKDVFGEDQQAVIQEFIGYCLLKAMPFHKAVMLIGEGANGKSTFLSLLKAFLGAENTAHATLQDLCNSRFASAQLFGKLANLCADLPGTAIASSGSFKTLTGADTISAEFKHKPAFNFMNYAKMLFSANKIPEVTEDTLAFFRRWLILICQNIFLGENCDPKILEKITTPQELSGLLNYALEGLKRLLEKGQFCISETIDDMRATYIRKSNSAKAFIEEQLYYENDPNVFVVETELYQSFILWCNRENLPTMKKAQFTSNMKEFFPEAKQTMQRILGKGTHVWQFVKLKETVTTVTTQLFTPEIQESNYKINTSLVTPVTDSKPIFGNGESEAKGYEPKQDVAYIKHIKTGEPCFNGCGLASEWQVSIGSDFKQSFCNSCFKKAKADLEQNGYEVKFQEGSS
jgi:P4 family phage/plasmid primase-like protien